MRPRLCLTLLLSVSFLSTFGCTLEEEARGRWQTAGEWSITSGATTVRGQVHGVGRNDEILLMLLADSTWDSKLTTHLSGDGLRGTGELPSVDGRQQTFTFDSPQAGTGEITIGTDTFDLANGRLFLIRTQSGPYEIEQMDRDPASLLIRNDSPSYTVDVDALPVFVETDANVREFLNVEQVAP